MSIHLSHDHTPCVKIGTVKTGSNTGFTLIEVLVALAIFSVVAIAASSAASSYINGVDRLRTKTLGSFVASNAVANMRMQGIWQTGTSTQTVSEQGREWEIVSTAKETPNENIRRVEIDVNALEGERKQGVHSVVVYVKRPAGASP